MENLAHRRRLAMPTHSDQLDFERQRGFVHLAVIVAPREPIGAGTDRWGWDTARLFEARLVFPAPAPPKEFPAALSES